MWRRYELKMRARECLKRYYWPAFVVSLVIAFLGSGINVRTTNNADAAVGNSRMAEFGGMPLSETFSEFSKSAGNIPIPNFHSKELGLITGLILGTALLVAVALFLFGVFVAPVLEVGGRRFYMESRGIGRSAGIGKLAWGFSHHYLGIVWTMFVKGFLISAVECLGALILGVPVLFYLFASPGRAVLTIMTLGIPVILAGIAGAALAGVYLAYCYHLVPYILSEAPGLRAMEVLRLSKKMMRGHKFRTFLLEFSFLGWLLLGMLCCGVGVLFVLPYVDATMAELYAELREPYLEELRAGWEDQIV
ncbi:MAG: DUF975 family protein [Lachnospiraceae bacterium]|nr:DUF975 family protein [Lachnospiraceae bacterium]